MLSIVVTATEAGCFGVPALSFRTRVTLRKWRLRHVSSSNCIIISDSEPGRTEQSPGRGVGGGTVPVWGLEAKRG